MPRRSRRRGGSPGWGKPLIIVAVLLLVLGGWWWQRSRSDAPAVNRDAPVAVESATGGNESALALPPVEQTGLGDGAPVAPAPLPPAPSPSTSAPTTSAPASTGALPAFLPPEAARTLQLIASGGPYPHAQDGSVFGNREGRLPRQPRGYYHEFTVDTPGLNHRGARRIVTGGNPPAEYYYTDDHYDSFRRFELPGAR